MKKSIVYLFTLIIISAYTFQLHGALQSNIQKEPTTSLTGLVAMKKIAEAIHTAAKEDIVDPEVTAETANTVVEIEEQVRAEAEAAAAAQQ